MASTNDKTTGGTSARSEPGDRKARLADELRANLLKRKAQSRSRRAGAADSRPEGLTGGSDDKTKR